jgi:endogenous inhibitor of DNA gyrase (YacG/DUF329 family)
MTAPQSSDPVCPTCGRSFRAESPEERRRLPFCSPRCKLIDLGKWFNEEYRISRELQPEELLDADTPSGGRAAES